jgi:hypothetical protein
VQGYLLSRPVPLAELAAGFDEPREASSRTA